MKKTYQFKLNLTSNQRQSLENWLDMLRKQYNYLLAQRFNWWKLNRSDVIIAQGEFKIRYCSIIPYELKDNPNWHSQSATLPQLKKDRPWYRQIYSQVLQDCVKRVKLAFERYIQGDSNGKRAGRPRFKKRSRYKTFTFPQVKQDWLFGNQIKLPKLGVLQFIKSRDIAEGFQLKTASITRKADGYYLSLSVEDKTVPEFEPNTIPTEDNTVAIDLGLEKLYTDSDKNQVLPEKHYRKSEEKLAKLQRKLEDNSRSKKAKRLIREAMARLHQTLARQRKDWHYQKAHELIRRCQVLAIEDLNIANLRRQNEAKKVDGHFVPNGQSAKSGLNKSFSDCAISQFVEILEHIAKKYGVRIIKVNPKNTSQICNKCLSKVSKTLSDRWHDCPDCGESVDRDYNSALLIKKLVVGNHQYKMPKSHPLKKVRNRCSE
jgi:putative transposase